MRKNLDPMLFADREFCSAILPANHPDQHGSSTSFIELTTQIGNEAKIMKP